MPWVAAMTAAMLATVVSHKSSGSCSAQPGLGVYSSDRGGGCIVDEKPRRPTSAARVLWVPDVDGDDILAHFAQPYPISIRTCLVRKYSSSPWWPSSTPSPLCFQPG